MRNVKFVAFSLLSVTFLAACYDSASSSSSSQTSSLSSQTTSSASSEEVFYPFLADSPLVFNEFDSGSSANDRVVELANASSSTLDLGAYSIAIYRSNDKFPSYAIALTGTLASHDVYVIASDTSNASVKAAADLGPLFLDGLADGIRIDAPHLSEKEIAEIELMILQAARVRMSRTEYIACPSCGRTLYDIEGTLTAIRARTSHLKNLKIGVMGCIVNGPGEMADADYGYVGAAPGRITLYKGRTVVEKNIPQEEALDRLVALIKANGDWADPENQPERP